jgi:glycosyltransferase involved in cell wall biosynthesis
VAEVIEAARRAPELDVHVTGDLGKCPDKLREDAPANVRFTGFLSGDAYGRAVSDADVVLALTTEPSSVVRAGYEAVYAERPLVVSDWPASREVFPHALHVENSPPAIVAGLRQAVSDRERLLALAPQALTLQETRWERQLEALRQHLIPTPTKRS